MSLEPNSVAASDPHAPPPALDWARVIAYAIVDSDVTWTGRQIPYVGDAGERLGPVPRLAICQNALCDTEDVMTFFCDDDWNVLGVTARPTVEENIEAAERWYSGITRKWVYTGLTQEAAEKWMREEYAELAWAFCNKLPPEVENMFSNSESEDDKAVYVCYGCIEGMYAAIHSAADKSSEPGST